MKFQNFCTKKTNTYIQILSLYKTTFLYNIYILLQTTVKQSFISQISHLKRTRNRENIPSMLFITSKKAIQVQKKTTKTHST